MVWLLNSQQGMKSCKSAESFCLSILTICTNDWSTYILTCLLLPLLFFSARFLNVCKPRTTFYLLWRAGTSGLAFNGSGPARLQRWLTMVNAGWLSSMWSGIFLQVKFIIFQGCPAKQAVFIPGYPAPFYQLIIQPLLLVPECYFA